LTRGATVVQSDTEGNTFLGYFGEIRHVLQRYNRATALEDGDTIGGVDSIWSEGTTFIGLPGVE
jgi:hypothetical protein